MWKLACLRASATEPGVRSSVTLHCICSQSKTSVVHGISTSVSKCYNNYNETKPTVVSPLKNSLYSPKSKSMDPLIGPRMAAVFPSSGNALEVFAASVVHSNR